MAAGDFNATLASVISLKSSAIWQKSDPLERKHAEAAVAVLKNQTAKFDVLDDPEKDKKVKVTFIKWCDEATEECEPTCDLNGDELETASREYEPNICQQAKIKSVNLEKFRTNTLNEREVTAELLMKQKKELDIFWAKRILTRLKGFAGVNVAPTPNPPFSWDATTNATLIADAAYGSYDKPSSFVLTTYLRQQMMKNRIADPYYIDNGSLWVEAENALLTGGTTDAMAIAARARLGQLNLNYDLLNFDAITNVSAFGLSKHAVAFKTVNRYGDRAELMGNKEWQWSVPSDVLPGVRYDVEMQETCKVVNNVKSWFRTYRMFTRGLIELSPATCPVTVGGQTVNPTGVLAYLKASEKIA